MKLTSARYVRHVRQRGQSTVEFMLMLPVIFSMLFFVIQMGLYFTTVHYGTYAAFATARSQQVGFSDTYSSAKEVSDLILTGAVWGSAVVGVESTMGDESGISVSLTDFERLVPFPFITKLMPNTKFKTSVYLGPRECEYEYRAEETRDPYMYDNNIKRSDCS